MNRSAKISAKLLFSLILLTTLVPAVAFNLGEQATWVVLGSGLISFVAILTRKSFAEGLRQVPSIFRSILLPSFFVEILMLAAMSVVRPNSEALSESARLRANEAVLKNISKSLKSFEATCGFYPSPEQGLDVLVAKPNHLECPNYPAGGFIKNRGFLLDSWGHEITYISNSNTFELNASHGSHLLVRK